METEGQKEAFITYNDSSDAKENLSQLRRYLGARDAELYTHLLEEEEQFTGSVTKKRVRLLFSHFAREAKRKASPGGQIYVYRPLTKEEILKLYGPRTLEEQARHLEAADARIRMLEKLREMEMLELAALIKEFRQRGLVSDAQTDAILSKVGTQCDALREENRRLQRELDARQTNVQLQSLKLLNEELQDTVDDQHNELAELRRQLGETVMLSDQVTLLRQINDELVARPLEQESTIKELTLQLSEVYGSLVKQFELNAEQQSLSIDKDSQIETLERDLSDARDKERQLRRENEAVQALKAYQAVQDRVIERHEEQMAEMQLLLEEARRELRQLNEKATVVADPRQLRQELEQSKLEYDRLYRESRDTEQELTRLYQEDLEELRQSPVHRLDLETAQPLETGETLGDLIDQKRKFYVIEPYSLGLAPLYKLNGGVGATTAHYMSQEEDALRTQFINAARRQSGRNRVRLSLLDNNGERQSELMIDSLAPQRVASFRSLELVLDMEQSQRVRYVYASALPRRMIATRGQLRVQKYNAEQNMGPEAVYWYDFQNNNRGTSVVTFADGAVMYATFVSASLFRLDLLILPL